MKDRSSYTVPDDVPREDTTEPLGLVLTCCTCDTTYEPTAENLQRGHFGCPDPDCGGWTFSTALVEPTTTTRTDRLSGGAA